MNKLNILIGCLLFREYTGSEMYVFELSKGLLKLGHKVSIISPNLGEPLISEGKKIGIQIYNFDNAPKEKFDLIHSQHQPVVSKLIELYPKTPVVCTIHSEVISIENPIVHPNIKKYIAIRPEIKKYIINNFFPIIENQVEVIFNPFDETRFNLDGVTDNGTLLFVGTIDFLRKNTLFDLVDFSKKDNKELCIVGKNHGDYLNQIISHSHVKYFQDTKNVEIYFKSCHQTAGILMGRTTIEGWLCGKPGWIYNVNSSGVILDKTLFNPPPDVDKFKSSKVLNKIENLYYEIKK